MSIERDDVERDVRRYLLRRLRRIQIQIRKGPFNLTDASVDVQEELGEIRLYLHQASYWDIRAWPYVIAALERRFDRERGAEADKIRSVLTEMRHEVEMVVILGLLPLELIPKDEKNEAAEIA